MRPPRLLHTTPGSRPEAFGPVEWGLLVGVSLMWGSSFLFIAIGVDSFAPAIVAFARLALGAMTLALFPRARARVEPEDWRRVAALGILWMAVPFVLFPMAEQRISSALAGMLNGAVPLLSALFAALLLKKLPNRSQVAGLILGFVGVAAIASPAVESSFSAFGVLLILVAVILYGISFNLAVPLQQRYGALPVLLRAQLVALAAVAPVAALQLPQSDWSWPSALAMLPLGVVSTGVALVAMTNLAGRAGAARGSIAIYFLPVVAVILGVIFRDETIAVLSLVGTALVLGGAWLTSRKESSG
ncbi:MAG: DMT family transporter [Actinomycetota bacterium]|nr:DMT family transporter [Actinomycetota bacterium]